MTDPVFQIKDASLKLDSNTGKVDILHGITLEIAQGETVAFTGPSGSGKSSLLMVMGGLEQATGGSVRALGQDLTTMSEDNLAKFRRGRMGIVFQSFHLIPTMTALENVATPLELDGAKDAFERARASAPRPAILLADEPTGNLDSVNGAAIMDMLFDLRKKHGATLVLVTHADDLAARCDRIITLTDGRIV